MEERFHPIKRWRWAYWAVTPAGGGILKLRRAQLAVGASLLIIMVTLAVFLLASQGRSPLPSTIRKQAAFPLYYPDRFPDDFSPDMSHITYDTVNGVFMASLGGANGHHLTLTEQQLPKNFTFDSLVGQGKVLDKVYGQAVLNNVEGRIVASMISPDQKTLILINSSDATNDEMIDIVRSLHPTH